MTDLGRQREFILNALGKDAESAVRQVQLRTLQALQSSNPVDTGWSRSAWTPAAGSPAAVDGVPPKEDGVTRTAAQRRLARNRQKAEAIARTYRLRDGPVFISNAVEYIVFLNAGSSSQAPANFVQRAIADAVASVRL